ncbi:hypothetical protein COV61_05440 [Candidatus Micrarchaeota archaeon CG11_big_fil_rev_8_21_14_0_20_47_5]|nr:MAG: hypothetical protein COV61_05440 [Candidatus Micrarchaeota archaeon CG11_big_fil_rev_8_21_14_0_20_47_5]
MEQKMVILKRQTDSFIPLKKIRYYKGSDVKQIQAITYHALGHYHERSRNEGLLYRAALKFGLEEHFDRSLACYNEAVKRIPKYAVAYNSRGNRHRTYYNNFQQAIKDYAKSITFDSNFFKAYINRGRAYVQIKRFDKAKIDLELASEHTDDQEEKKEIEENLAYVNSQLSKLKNSTI